MEFTIEQLNEKLGEGKNVEQIFRDAQRVYNHWSELPPSERTASRLLSNLSFDFFDLLFCFHSKSLFFVKNEKSKVVKFNIF